MEKQGREGQKSFWICTLLYCEPGNPVYTKIQNFEFSQTGFPCLEDKRAKISKIFLSFFTLFL